MEVLEVHRWGLTKNFQLNQQLQQPQIVHSREGTDHASGPYKQPKPTDTKNKNKKKEQDQHKRPPIAQNKCYNQINSFCLKEWSSPSHTITSPIFFQKYKYCSTEYLPPFRHCLFITSTSNCLIINFHLSTKQAV